MVHLNINFVGQSPSHVFHIEMPSETQIIDLKIRIKINYPYYEGKRQILSFNGQILSDKFRTLRSYGIIGDEANLDLSLTPPKPNTRFGVWVIGFKTFVLQVQGDMKVEMIKQMIAEKWGFSSNEISLVHKHGNNEEEMDDDEILHNYNIDGDYTPLSKLGSNRIRAD